MLKKHRIQQLLRHPVLRMCLCVWVGWTLLMCVLDAWNLFQDYAFVSFTMAFASFIAGSTSEGGGAVAFPVFTIIFDIAPAIARDFSLMIQSVGMTAAAYTIFSTKVRVEKRAIVFASIGGIPGMFIGLYWISPLVSPSQTKMFFVSLWLAFGIIVGLQHYYRRNLTARRIPNFSRSTAGQLLVLGLIGGTISGITGSGLDIVVFSFLVLEHQVDTRIATATSVVLMAGNALVGFSMRLVDANPLDPVTWNYWLVSIPIVVVGAPLGARFIANRSREFVAGLLFTTILAQFIGAIVIVPQTLQTIGLVTITFLTGLLLFSGTLSQFIEKCIAWVSEDREKVVLSEVRDA